MRALAAACIDPAGKKVNDHVAPEPLCRCGIYAARDQGRLRGYHNAHTLHVVGLVELWGNVVEHVEGWRARFAYPRWLWLPVHDGLGNRIEAWDEVAFDLAAYGVPVEPMEGSELDGLPERATLEDARWLRSRRPPFESP